MLSIFVATIQGLLDETPLLVVVISLWSLFWTGFARLSRPAAMVKPPTVLYVTTCTCTSLCKYAGARCSNSCLREQWVALAAAYEKNNHNQQREKDGMRQKRERESRGTERYEYWTICGQFCLAIAIEFMEYCICGQLLCTTINFAGISFRYQKAYDYVVKRMKKPPDPFACDRYRYDCKGDTYQERISAVCWFICHDISLRLARMMHAPTRWRTITRLSFGTNMVTKLRGRGKSTALPDCCSRISRSPIRSICTCHTDHK